MSQEKTASHVQRLSVKVMPNANPTHKQRSFVQGENKNSSLLLVRDPTWCLLDFLDVLEVPFGIQNGAEM